MEDSEKNAQFNEQSAGESNSNETLALIRLLWFNRRFVLGCALGTALFTAMISLLFLTTRYEATAVIMPIQKSSPAGGLSLGSGDLQLGELLNIGSSAQQMIRFREVLKSRQIAQTVAQKEGFLVDDKGNLLSPRKFEKEVILLQRGIDITMDGEVIRIQFEHPLPEKAASVVQSFLDALKTFLQTSHISQAKNTAGFIAARLEEMERKLEETQNRYIELQTKKGVVELPTQLQYSLGTASDLRKRLVDKDLEIATFQDVMRSKNDLDRLVTERKQIKEQLNKIIAGEDQKSDSSEVEIFTPLSKAPKLAKEFAEAERIYLSQVQLVNLLREQLELVQIEAKKEEPIFQVIDPPYVPVIPSFPKKKLLTIIGMFAGFVFSILALLLRRQYQALAPLLQDPVLLNEKG